MNILIISEYFPSPKELRFSGGVEARNLFVGKYLAKKHKVTIITSHLFGQKDKERLYGFDIIRVGKKRKYNATAGSIVDRLSFIREAISSSKYLKADIVEGTNFLTHFIAKRISATKNIPSVAWYPDVWFGKWIANTGFYGLFGEILERINLKFGFDAYIAISKETANKLCKHIKQNVHVIYCGVEKEKSTTKSIKSNKATIICVSRLAKYKNIKTLIFAFADLAIKIKNSQLIIVGNGPEKENLKKMCKELNIGGKIKFYSNVSRSNLINLYKSAHIFSLPSRVEGFGISTIEAASFGLPYVNSDIPVQKEITRNGQGGFLVDPNSPLEFSRKFFQLLSNKELYLKKSAEAKNLSRIYNWQTISKQTEQVYRSLT